MQRRRWRRPVFKYVRILLSKTIFLEYIYIYTFRWFWVFRKNPYVSLIIYMVDQDRIRFLLCDYRQLPHARKYDRIISWLDLSRFEIILSHCPIFVTVLISSLQWDVRSCRTWIYGRLFPLLWFCSSRKWTSCSTGKWISCH